VGRLTRVKTAAKILWRHRRRPKEDTLVDVAFLAGLAAFASGWGWIYSPLAPIIGGALLALAAFIYGSRAKPTPPPPAVEDD
jgi:apolipoprotein N-acyltransferase